MASTFGPVGMAEQGLLPGSPGRPLGTGGARLVVLRMPAKRSFGIDAMTYTTGPNFQGIRGLPLGLHFCHFTVGSEEFGGKHGFFFTVTSPLDVVVWEFDPSGEDLCPASRASITEEAVGRLREAALRGELDAQLGPYSTYSLPLWTSSSSHLTPEVLARLGLVDGGKVLPGDGPLDSDDELAPSDAARSHAQAVVPYFGEDGRSAHFTPGLADAAAPRVRRRTRRVPGNGKEEQQTGEQPLAAGDLGHESDVGAACEEPSSLPVQPPQHQPSHLHLAGLAPKDRTQWCRDAGARLESLLTTEFKGRWELLLGELQAAFLLFNCIFSVVALRQWKQFVGLLCHCGPASLQAHPGFFAEFVHILRTQLTHVPEDFFAVELTDDNFLEASLRSLFLSAEDLDAPVEPFESARRELLAFVQEKYHLFRGGGRTGAGSGHGTLTQLLSGFEEDEDLPVVVGADELSYFAQRQTTGGPEGLGEGAERKGSERGSGGATVGQPGGRIGSMPLDPLGSFLATRYPHVHALMKPCEDPVMACRRVLEDAGLSGSTASGKEALQEALRFMEEQVGDQRSYYWEAVQQSA